MNDTYEIGYKKPPKSSQFKKGKSGNPKGRPKKKQTTNDLFTEELNKKKLVNMGGKEVWITNHKLLVRRAMDKAVVDGDFRMIKLLIDISSQNITSEFDINEHDENALERFLQNNK